jgi:uncharacterized membrane-anchored protein YitT (DUF2179 family)
MIPEYKPIHVLGCLLALFVAGVLLGIGIGIVIHAGG